ncbi:IclR family transcriptional regulator [Sphaerisporangium krabiense]|uniref:Glycerol operon regulatory protein n=1 Tax=Sphaerisporangium krabiense TaxID=763782 RepID=A0A7W8Z774_9ACTN|nr:IclR family transcriptional regulator [Sphaerisporangium krabiense]MBB5628652.1 DNA-binding IclR family transcriptional regulator [Sphaerisporangium krabiense]GII60508.1 IclR family transcriptional regulator [Sphaerisporangium krabiense]
MIERETSVPHVKSAVRTVEMLDFFARNPGLHGLPDLQARLGYPKSSLHALLRTLADLGWIETDATGTLYRAGLRTLLVGATYIDGDPVVQLARDALDWLAEATGETVHLGRLDRFDVVYLATRASRHSLRPVTRVGARLPASTTSLGKAILAAREEGEVARLLPAELPRPTRHAIADRDRLAADLRRIRRRGYAVDREESVDGLRCFGVALDVARPPRDAVSVSVPVPRLTTGRDKEIAACLLEARDRIELAARGAVRAR